MPAIDRNNRQRWPNDGRFILAYHPLVPPFPRRDAPATGGSGDNADADVPKESGGIAQWTALEERLPLPRLVAAPAELYHHVVRARALRGEGCSSIH